MQYANDNNISGNYSEVFSKLTPDDHNIIDNIVLAKYSKAIKDRENVIIDMTNMSPKSRRKWSNIPKSYKKRAIVFYIGDKKLHERNTIRAREGKYIRHNVFESMYSRFIVPTYDEVDEIYYVL
jgi:predicted kinase